MYDPDDLSDATDPWWDQFPARLDGYALGPDKKPLLVGGQHVYRGVEQEQNTATALFSDSLDGRVLDGTAALLFERNNLPIDPYGGVVLARFRGMVGGKLAYDFDATPADLDEITLSGSGGCDFTFGGSGEVCFGEDVTVNIGGTTIINNTVILGNWYDLSYVTTVCPVYSDHLTIDGVLRSVSPPVVTGLVVERRVVRVPLGTVVGDPYCELDPDYCCESGSGSGSGHDDSSCCEPMPPDVLWATLIDSSTTCECLPVCVELLYDPARDAWYSTAPVSLECPPGAGGTQFLRLRCRAGVWFFDVVTAADVLTIMGVVVRVVCDPFYVRGDFEDSTVPRELCGGPVAGDSSSFVYVITEVDCSGDGSGSGSGGGGGGGGGTVATPCCPDDLLPATLTATFGGALAGLGTVTLTYVGTGTSWTGSTSGPCGNVNVTLICDTIADKWEMALLGDTSGGWELVVADSCDPLLINATFRAITGACGTGTGTVEVTG
jgi:hypothetical protein